MSSAIVVPDEARSLGKPLSRHDGLYVGRLLVGIVMVIVLLLYMLFVKDIILALDTGAKIFVIVIGLLPLIIAIVMLAQAFQLYELRVIVQEKGLTVMRGSNTRVIPWEDIAQVYEHVAEQSPVRPFFGGILISLSRRYKYTYAIQLEDLTNITFDDSIQFHRQLGDSIQKQTALVMIPRFKALIESGQGVPFGAVSVTKSGLSNGRETIPWDQVDEVRVDSSRIAIRKRGKALDWVSQRAASTPNLLVLTTLLDEVVVINRKR